MADATLQISIYKFRSSSGIRLVSEKTETAGFNLQTLINEELSGFTLRLYYKHQYSLPKWKGFVSTIATPSEPILFANRSSIESFVLLLNNEEKNILYGVTGGLGHFAIQDDIDDDFGMNVFSRLLKREDHVLRSTREKGVVGNVLGRTQHFRRYSNLYEIDSFGKIYQELKANIQKDILVERMGLSESDVKTDSVCIAKSSFRINKAISFQELLKVIEGCESILGSEEVPVQINDVERITAKRDKQLLDQLSTELFGQIWTRYSNKEASVAFDLCDRDYEKYLTASKYIVRKGTSKKNLFDDHEFEELTDIDSLLEQIRTLDNKPETKDAFIKLIKSIMIFSFDENNTLLTKGDLAAHLMGDVTFLGQKYFFIDRTWFRIKERFVADLNMRCKTYIERNFFGRLPESWDYPNEEENNYSAKYLGKENCIVLDKVTPENIEPCDILQWDERYLYFIHVKAGFGNTMRDLCSQVLIAANRISQSVISSKTYVGKIYDSMRSKIGGTPYFDLVGLQTQRYSREEFMGLFAKELVFVLAVCDTTTGTERDIHSVEKFNSNIAKFSLQELSRDMRALEVSFKVAQVSRFVDR